MWKQKSDAQAVAQSRDSESHSDGLFSEKKGTAEDQKDIFRLGKKKEKRKKFCFFVKIG